MTIIIVHKQNNKKKNETLLYTSNKYKKRGAV